MNKVLICIPSYSFFCKPLKTAFRQLGYKVYFTDYRHGDLVAKLLGLFLTQNISKKYISLKIYLTAVITKPDIFLTIKGESIDFKLLKKISKRNIITINWFPDPLNLFELIKKIAPYYDYFFHFDPFVVRKLKKEGMRNVFYLPFAAEIFAEREKIKYEISFVGTYDAYREKILLHLSEFKLNIWGDKRWGKSKLRQFVRGDRVTASEMHRIIKRSKININLHHPTTREGTNLRTFQVTGCRAFLLTECISDLYNLFKRDKEIICFKNPQELRELAKYYLKKESLREKIAKAGFRRVQKDHTYTVRVNQMLHKIYA